MKISYELREDVVYVKLKIIKMTAVKMCYKDTIENNR